MKYLLILLLSFPALAEDKLCDNAEKYAATVMELRQDGARLKDVMDRATSNTTKLITIMAYKVRRSHTDEYKKMRVDDFANEVYLACLEGGQTK